MTEEELTILNPAREDVAGDLRERLGAVFAEERNAQIEAECGRVDNVRKIVQRAEQKDLLDNN